jgi:hypothetical protein
MCTLQSPGKRRYHREQKVLRQSAAFDTISTSSIPNVVILLQPSLMTPIEYAWTWRICAWERALIRAQSMAGYFATLGGGYFMCHHWQTAVRLAQHQQAMAYILGDTSMMYKCVLNQAYNYIHAGRFRRAHRWIRYVYDQVRDKDTVLTNMCKSAHLFARRVRQLNATSLGSYDSEINTKDNHDNQRRSRTMDDYARVRLVQDQSTSNDRLIV